MKLQILSDLHCEFYQDRGAGVVNHVADPSADVLVAAGDIAICKILEEVLANLASRYPHVVYVPGNHEYYKASPAEVAQVRECLAGRCANLHWLEEETVEIDGQRFVGTTLWFNDAPGSLTHRRGLADFSVIRDFAPWVFDKNRAAVRFLRDTLHVGDIVVTHHLPSQQSVARMYRGSPLNAFFVHDVEPLILERQPTLWVHGHTHTACDYTIDKTRVVCNPFGYPHEPAQGFVKNKIVEI